MIRIIHAADLHLDSPFEGLSRALAARRRKEQRDLLPRIAALAAEREADLLLLSGDLFDTGAAYLETAACLENALGGVSIPVFIAPGNHDYYAKGSPWTLMELPEHVHVFRTGALSCVPLPALGCRVWGAAFTDRSSGPLLRDFQAEKQDGLLDILCLHGELDAPNSTYNPISRAELARSGMDYAALGHVHSFGGLLRAGDCFCAWPGCPEGRGFDETGDKGVLYVELSPGACRAEFVPLCARRYADVTVDVSGAEDPHRAVLDALPPRTDEDIYRLTLTGEASAPVNLGALERQLAQRFFVLRLRDRTRPARDLWDGVGEDSLRGLFLLRLKKKYDNARDEEARAGVAAAVRWGLAALDHGEEVSAL